MKKKCCLLLCFLIIFPVFSSAELHWQIQGSFNDITADDIYADLIHNQDTTEIITSFAPDTVLELNDGSGDNLLAALQILPVLFCTEDIVIYVPILRERMHKLAESENFREADGKYTGDLFDSAGTITTVDMDWDIFKTDMESALSGLNESEEKLFSRLRDVLCTIPTRIKRNPGETVRIRLKSFNRGTYFVLEACEEEKLMLVVSADLSSAEQPQFLIRYAEGGKTYYHLVSVKAGNDTNEILSCYYSGNRETFRSAKEYDPILTEHLITEKTGADHCQFKMTVYLQRVSEPFFITGEAGCESDLLLRIQGKAFIGEEQEKAFVFTLTAADEETKTKGDHDDLQHVTDSAKYGGMMTDKLIITAVQLFSGIPDTYQNLIQNLLFE